MNCDIMDGRDAFLTLAREKHYEFSSLRRAKFSTMAMLVELHNNGADRFVYSCNICKRHVETRYHCNECEVYRQSLFIVVLIQDLLPSHLGQSNFPITFFFVTIAAKTNYKANLCVCACDWVRMNHFPWNKPSHFDVFAPLHSWFLIQPIPQYVTKFSQCLREITAHWYIWKI